MRTTTTFLFLLLSATLSFGSVQRIEISKATQTESPIKFSVTITPDDQQDGQHLVELVLPAGQKELAELWKVYLWIVQDKKTSLGAPLDLSYAKDKSITVRFNGHVDTLSHCQIAIRCGQHAPLSETIYQIDVGSYLNNKAEQGNNLIPRSLATDAALAHFRETSPNLAEHLVHLGDPKPVVGPRGRAWHVFLFDKRHGNPSFMQPNQIDDASHSLIILGTKGTPVVISNKKQMDDYKDITE